MALIDNQGMFPKPEFRDMTEPSRLKKLGNTEFLDCFLASYLRKFNLQKVYPELCQDPQVQTYYEGLKKHLNLTYNSAHTVYDEFIKEAGNRGLDVTMMSENGGKMYDTETFTEWQRKMKNTPTYIREIWATNYLGDMNLTNFDEILDYPAREACRVLNDKGYKTYWSSANIEDFESRNGDVVLGKSVAYILIDYHNLNSELKDSLFLSGKNKLWGVALSHGDGGKYYGIWSEITSPDMLCSDLSDSLVKIASNLPDLNPFSK